MFKGKLTVLLVAALLVVSSSAFAGIIDPCNSTATVELSGAPTLPVTYRSCPQGDGGSMLQNGFYISLTIKDGLGDGIPNISPTDFWLDDCDPGEQLFVLCGGSASSGADSLTNGLGQTTMSATNLATGQFNAGDISCLVGTPPCADPPPATSAKCSNGVIIIVQGEILLNATCTAEECYPVNVRSFDLNGTGSVNSSDFSIFAIGYVGGVGVQNPCTDYNSSSSSDLPDLTIFSLHYGPPGHSCD